jgi:hypothetical protein
MQPGLWTVRPADVGGILLGVGALMLGWWVLDRAAPHAPFARPAGGDHQSR